MFAVDGTDGQCFSLQTEWGDGSRRGRMGDADVGRRGKIADLLKVRTTGGFGGGREARRGFCDARRLARRVVTGGGLREIGNLGGWLAGWQAAVTRSTALGEMEYTGGQYYSSGRVLRNQAGQLLVAGGATRKRAL